MDTLRLLIGVIGLLLIAGLFFYEHHRARSMQYRSIIERLLSWKKRKVGPSLGELLGTQPQDERIAASRQQQQRAVEVDEMEPMPTKPEPAVIYLALLAQEGSRFAGDELYTLLLQLGFNYGEMGIFHRLDLQGRPLISIANLHEPGSFEIDPPEQMSTAGLWLFIQLPAVSQTGSELFDELMDVATRLGENLQGRLCDAHQQPLAESEYYRMRHQAAAYDDL
ncbi:MAG: cell division protein ZipA C-terminal FtsZ-binding domain-containing protein [Gammaproteobacteria bacterium]|nr:cell division protein ZipA C-terminal FtsZ-binding domain-containing protein [Gammaproteobacteria bacterium]